PLPKVPGPSQTGGETFDWAQQHSPFTVEGELESWGRIGRGLRSRRRRRAQPAAIVWLAAALVACVLAGLAWALVRTLADLGSWPRPYCGSPMKRRLRAADDEGDEGRSQRRIRSDGVPASATVLSVVIVLALLVLLVVAGVLLIALYV